MNTRFQLALLVERRIESILKDAEQLARQYPMLKGRVIVSHLVAAQRAAHDTTVYLTELGEGETKQDDFPNLTETSQQN